MKSNRINAGWLMLLALLSTVNYPLSTAHAQGSAFTYQGRLNNNAAPANGSYDFRFRLASDPNGNTYVGSPVQATGVSVSNGLFLATLDFGGAFTGGNYWLEVDVKTNSAVGYTVLSPLQGVTPTPYAVFANTASNLSGTVPSAALTSVPATSLTGTLPPTSLPAMVVTNTETGVALGGAFSGNGGGLTNLTLNNANYSVIAGGQGNTVSGTTSMIGGGQNNTNNANQSSIGGGSGNVIQTGAYQSFLGSGSGNVIQTNSDTAFLGSGYHNLIQMNAASAFLGGGQANTILNNADHAVLGGGYANTNTGAYSTIPGGQFNVAGINSFAAGDNARATNSGAFVWADAQGPAFGSTASNQFNVRANGGVRFITGGAGITLDGALLQSSPPGMAVIPAGTFTMGDNLDGEADAVPTNITVSAFYMDVNLVSYAQWQSVYFWATNNGYSFVNPGSGKAANHPVVTVDWYDSVKWSNARSQQAGLTPVYYTDAGLTQVYTNGEVTVYVNWSAKGYRLPTEAEWEKAARGGLSGQRFPWGNLITENLADYTGNTSLLSYDLGPNGENAAFTNGVPPYTSPVGYFAANGYGLNDMAGNIFEWCWDWYGTPYGQPTTTNPTGPATGSGRIRRGGFWGNYASLARCAGRSSDAPIGNGNGVGFRCVRTL